VTHIWVDVTSHLAVTCPKCVYETFLRQWPMEV
jgi:hypothetical protein